MNALAFRRTAGVMVLALALVATLTTISISPASAAHVDPTFVTGNPTCGSLGFDNEFKVEPVSSGQHTDGTLTVDITVLPGNTFDWSANFALSAVVAKGGPNANLYEYVPAVTSDTGLHAPVNPSGGWAGLSHISFCYDVTDVTSTTQPEETTTTQPGETTTTLPEVGAETTTTQPGETATTPPEVGAETTTTQPGVTPTTPPEVGAETTVTTPDDTLPFTGVDSDRLALMSLLAIAGGSALVALTRRSGETRGRHLAR